MKATQKTNKLAKAKAKNKRIKTDKVSPKIAKIQRQLGATLLPW